MSFSGGVDVRDGKPALDVNGPFAAEEITHAVDALPSAPRILAELAPLLQQADIPLDDIAALIRRDAGLTARLIAAANSAAYVGSVPSVTLDEAIARIGYRETYRIIGAVACAHLADKPLRLYGMTPQRLRENALFVALMMEELAPEAGLEPRAAYTIGLLRSLGKVVLNHIAGERGGVEPYGDCGLPLAGWEIETIGYSNPVVGAEVLRHWRFPDETADAVRDHYAPAETSGAATHLLNLTAGGAEDRDYGLPGESEYWQFTPANFAATSIDEKTVRWAGERARRAMSRISSALG
ncbi:MAG TPA: HDOD domain-containing protein [Opitutaceae bacterium]|nr:HDOD domain-containing protein [Opitutaceae bacterium]